MYACRDWHRSNARSDPQESNLFENSHHERGATDPAGPRALQPFPMGARLSLVSEPRGRGGGRGVSHCAGDSAPGALYRKHGRGPVATDVFDEAVRLRWFAGHVPVPTVRLMIASTESDRSDRGEALVTAGAHEPETWLLMDAVRGRPTASAFVRARGTRLIEA
jgi:aminoglycoside phosphotransferase